MCWHRAGGIQVSINLCKTVESKDLACFAKLKHLICRYTKEQWGVTHIIKGSDLVCDTQTEVLTFLTSRMKIRE